MATDSKTTLKARFRDMVKGIGKRFTDDVTIGGVRYTPAALAAVFTEADASILEADAAWRAWQDALSKRARRVKQASQVHAHVRQFIVGTYGEEAKIVFADFGMAAPKRRGRRSAAAKAAAAVKGKATRELRGTMGPKQKKAIKSNVQVKFVTKKGV
jgi:hypothetical protein